MKTTATRRQPASARSAARRARLTDRNASLATECRRLGQALAVALPLLSAAAFRTFASRPEFRRFMLRPTPPKGPAAPVR